jgi:fluoride exporter
MTPWLWLAVAGIGGIGSIGRFVIDALVSGRYGRDFPLGTLTINLTGTFLLGVLVGVGAQGNLYLLAGTATMGSFTTFSTWMLETYRLISLVLGFGAALLGRAIGLQL